MISFENIRQRKLVQWGIGYLAGAWVMLQVLAFGADSFNWPPQIARFATIIAIAGFLAVLVIAWYHGERGRQRATPTEVMVLGMIAVMGVTAAWTLRGEAGDSRRGPAPSNVATAAEKNSIAVLPFVDMSGGSEQEYFSDGVAEEILNGLARIPGLRVAARTSSFSFRNKDVPISDVAAQLRVANVLEGSVRRSGDRVRITAQLIDASNGYRVWSETFDRQLEDIFAVQDEISRAIADRLRVQFASTQTEATVTTNQGAYDAFLRGRYNFARRTPDALRRAEQYFKTSSTLDPNYAPAYAGLAATLLVLPLYVDANIDDIRPRARKAVVRSLELDSTLAEAWAGLGYIRMSYDHDWEGAAAAFDRALSLNPNDANTHMWYGDFLAAQGRIAESIPRYARAAQLDALSATRHVSLGWMLMATRRFDDSNRELQLAIELDSTLIDGHTHFARLRGFQGHHAEAIRILEQAVTRSGRRAVEVAFLGHAYARAARRADAERILAELEARRSEGTATPLTVAFVEIGLGDHDSAFRNLELARRTGDMWLTENNADLVFDPLRPDPRWPRLLKRMGVAAPE